MLGKQVDWVLVIAISLVPVIWVPVYSYQGITVEVSYVGILILGVAAALSHRMRGWILTVIYRLRYLTLSFLVWWLVLLIAFVAYDTHDGTKDLVRQLVYYGYFILIAARLVGDKNPEVTLSYSVCASATVFIIFLIVSAHSVGVGIIGAIGDILKTGDYETFLYRTLRPIFNAHVEDGAAPMSVAGKNNINAFFFVMVAVYLASRGTNKSVIIRQWMLASCVIMVLFGLVSSTRVVFAAYTLAAVYISIRHVKLTRKNIIGLTMGIYLALIAVLVLYTAGVIHPEIVTDVIFRGTYSYGVRVDTLAAAAAIIEENYLLGAGFISFNNLDIHNIFISSFAYAGLAGLISCITLYVLIVYHWAQSTRRLADGTKLPAVPNMIWINCIPILPIIRVWVSGSSGHISYMEWTGLGIFFAFYIRYEQKSKKFDAVSR